MAVVLPTTTRAQGGPWDVVYQFGNYSLGALTEEPGRKSRVSQFAANIRSGGDAGYAYSSAVFQKLLQHGFDHGGDLRLFEGDNRRYNYSDGRVSMIHEDRITLASQWRELDTSITATARQILDFSTANGDYICVGVNGKLRVYDTNSQTMKDQGTWTGDAIYLYANDQYLFVAVDNGGTLQDAERWDGTDGGGWTTLSAPATKARCFAWYNNKLYYTNGNSLYPADANNVGTSWGTAVKFGWDSTDITDVANVNTVLVITKPEGYFLYDGSDTYEILMTEETRYDDNGIGLTNYDGAVYVPHMSEVKKVSVSGVSSFAFGKATPDMEGTTDKERYDHGFAQRFFKGPGNKLYGIFDDGQGVYPEMMMTQGIGWHQIYRGTSGDAMNAGGYSRLAGYLLLQDGTTLRYKRLDNLSDAEYPDYASSGQMTTADYDAGLPDINKSWSSITLDVRDCDDDNTIGIEYSTDKGETWLPDTPIELSSDGKQTVFLDSANLVVNSEQIRFRFTLTRDAADISKSPVIKLPVVISMRAAPPEYNAVQDLVIVDPNQTVRNYSATVSEKYSTAQMLDLLDKMGRTTDVIKRIDEFGRRSWLAMSDKAEIQLVRPTADEAEDGITESKGVVALTFIEVYNGDYAEGTGGLAITGNTSESIVGTHSGKLYGLNSYGFHTYGS
jgi:hypothetical protein